MERKSNWDKYTVSYERIGTKVSDQTDLENINDSYNYAVKINEGKYMKRSSTITYDPDTENPKDNVVYLFALTRKAIEEGIVDEDKIQASHVFYKLPFDLLVEIEEIKQQLTKEDVLNFVVGKQMDENTYKANRSFKIYMIIVISIIISLALALASRLGYNMGYKDGYDEGIRQKVRKHFSNFDLDTEFTYYKNKNEDLSLKLRSGQIVDYKE